MAWASDPAPGRSSDSRVPRNNRRCAAPGPARAAAPGDPPAPPGRAARARASVRSSPPGAGRTPAPRSRRSPRRCGRALGSSLASEVEAHRELVSPRVAVDVVPVLVAEGGIGHADETAPGVVVRPVVPIEQVERIHAHPELEVRARVEGLAQRPVELLEAVRGVWLERIEEAVVAGGRVEAVHRILGYALASVSFPDSCMFQKMSP